MARGRKTGGRKAGTPNKDTGEIRELVRGALDKLGGVSYLVSQGQANPAAFLSLVGRIIPQEMKSQLTHEGGIIAYVVTGVPKQPGSEK